MAIAELRRSDLGGGDLVFQKRTGLNAVDWSQGPTLFGAVFIREIRAGSQELPVGQLLRWGWQVPGVADKQTHLRGPGPLKCRKNVTLQRNLTAAVTWLSSGGQEVNMQPQTQSAHL